MHVWVVHVLDLASVPASYCWRNMRGDEILEHLRTSAVQVQSGVACLVKAVGSGAEGGEEDCGSVLAMFSKGQRVFACTQCLYELDCKTHVKSHFWRIHQNSSRQVLCKRKFQLEQQPQQQQLLQVGKRVRRVGETRKQHEQQQQEEEDVVVLRKRKLELEQPPEQQVCEHSNAAGAPRPPTSHLLVQQQSWRVQDGGRGQGSVCAQRRRWQFPSSKQACIYMGGWDQGCAQVNAYMQTTRQTLLAADAGAAAAKELVERRDEGVSAENEDVEEQVRGSVFGSGRVEHDDAYLDGGGDCWGPVVEGDVRDALVLLEGEDDWSCLGREWDECA